MYGGIVNGDIVNRNIFDAPLCTLPLHCSSKYEIVHCCRALYYCTVSADSTSRILAFWIGRAKNLSLSDSKLKKHKRDFIWWWWVLYWWLKTADGKIFASNNDWHSPKSTMSATLSKLRIKYQTSLKLNWHVRVSN